jgi:hypothetical protein
LVLVCIVDTRSQTCENLEDFQRIARKKPVDHSRLFFIYNSLHSGLFGKNSFLFKENEC